jgi:hypothetical protein
MHRSAEGIFEPGDRDGADFFLIELVQGDGAEAEVVVEARDERSAALAARVAAATAAALGLATGEDSQAIEAFDADTAAIIAANPTPEVAMPAGAWTARNETDEDTR